MGFFNPQGEKCDFRFASQAVFQQPANPLSVLRLGQRRRWERSVLFLWFQSHGNTLAKLRVGFGKVIYHALLDGFVRFA